MKHVPKYLLPRIAPVADTTASADGAVDSQGSAPTQASDVGFVPFNKGRGRGRGRGRGGRGGRGGGRGGKRKADPLKKFG